VAISCKLAFDAGDDESPRMAGRRELERRELMLLLPPPTKKNNGAARVVANRSAATTRTRVWMIDNERRTSEWCALVCRRFIPPRVAALRILVERESSFHPKTEEPKTENREH